MSKMLSKIPSEKKRKERKTEKPKEDPRNCPMIIYMFKREKKEGLKAPVIN